MDDKSKVTLVLGGLTVAFAALAISFFRVPAVPGVVKRAPLILPQTLPGIVPPGTVRISAGQLLNSSADSSGLQCYACHDQKKPPVIKYDSNHHIILPKEHSDLIIAMRNCAECHSAGEQVKLDYAADGRVIIPPAHKDLAFMAHGSDHQNDNCYNCHDPDHLDKLHTAQGATLELSEATLLCASCHGTLYESWQKGDHGRTNGYWDRKLGPAVRQECTSCHDPHSPAFPLLIPLPPPHPLHPMAISSSASKGSG